MKWKAVCVKVSQSYVFTYCSDGGYDGLNVC